MRPSRTAAAALLRASRRARAATGAVEYGTGGGYAATGGGYELGRCDALPLTRLCGPLAQLYARALGRLPLEAAGEQLPGRCHEGAIGCQGLLVQSGCLG